jgi:hypothetical protein
MVIRGGRKPLFVEDISTIAATFGDEVPIPRAPAWFNRIFSVAWVMKDMLKAAGLENPVFSMPLSNVKPGEVTDP